MIMMITFPHQTQSLKPHKSPSQNINPPCCYFIKEANRGLFAGRGMKLKIKSMHSVFLFTHCSFLLRTFVHWVMWVKPLTPFAAWACWWCLKNKSYTHEMYFQLVTPFRSLFPVPFSPYLTSASIPFSKVDRQRERHRRLLSLLWLWNHERDRGLQFPCLSPSLSLITLNFHPLCVWFSLFPLTVNELQLWTPI